MVVATFRELEHQGWLKRADAYRGIFGKITVQAIDPILDTYGDLGGQAFLDIASGTGELAAAAAARGAKADGVDFAATMVCVASGAHPQATFHEGDAEQLPFPDGSFDAVSCSFGLLHIQNADRAIAEAFRVLRPGGRYTATSWCGPDNGGEFFDLLLGAVEQYGSMETELPPAPPFFRFGDTSEGEKALAAAGFVDARASLLQLQWTTNRSNDALDLIYKSVVRMPMILRAQPEAARERIHEAILAGAEERRDGETIRFAFPAAMVTGQVSDR